MRLSTSSRLLRGFAPAFVVAGALAVAAVAFAYSGPAVVTHPTGNHVSCMDFGYPSNGVFASQGLDGQYNQDHQGTALSVTVTISNYQPGVGQNPATFDWSSTAPISAVFVKAGSNSDPQNLYTYAQAVTSDTGLESPKPTISHVLFCYSPTAVRLQSFSAARTRSGVLLRWRTAAEVSHLGFNVYRQEHGKRIRLNAAMISAGASAGLGHGYRWLDKRAHGAGTYWLQAVATSGARSWVASANAQ
jgi:hypothetical protein